MPYPCNFHYDHHIQRPFLWEMNNDRSVIVSYIGSFQASCALALRLRLELQSFCAQDTITCKHTNYQGKDRADSLRAEDADPHHGLSLNSIFCFQPLGDLPMRKGLFDGIMFGCIPVVFHPLTASAMYTWHWSAKLWRDVVVEIPINLGNPDKPVLYSDPVQYLKNMVKNDPKGIARRQRLLRQHAFELQYTLEFYKKGSSWPLDEEGRPMRDAYEISMDSVLNLHGGKIIRRPTKVTSEAAKEKVWRMFPNEYASDFERLRTLVEGPLLA